MGDPRKQKKKYAKPSHPWQGDRINAERKIMSEYGLRNKKELWKMGTMLRDIKRQAKSLITQTSEQSAKQKQLFLTRLTRLGVINNINAKLEDILDLDLKAILERRLQTIVYRKGLAKTVDQARQFIIHGHVIVNKKKLDISSYIVPVGEETSIDFMPLSTLASIDHPERTRKDDKKQKAKAAEKPAEKPEAEEALPKAEAAAGKEQK